MFRNINKLYASITPIIIPELKKYSDDEIKKHNQENDAWVSYQGNVYNISEFIDKHPGGKDKILKSAGGHLEPFWKIYQQHNTQPVHDILKKYHIGYTDSKSPETNDPYLLEPIRNEELIVHKQKPFNAEPNLIVLRENYITPNKFWFVRNHHPVPNINIDEYNLSFKNNNTEIKLDYQELINYPEINVISTIQCAGNRRKEFNNIETTLGLSWDCGAISNAKWTGVSLKTVLENNKLLDNINGNEFVNLIGEDQPFDCSIPIKKVIDDEVILAYQMNNEDIPLDHGYPIRVIVLGYSGAKNIKWIKEINISNQESTSTWQRGIAYKGLPSNIKDTSQIGDISHIPTIEDLPVQSFICDIDLIENNIYKIKGIAYSGGGRNIIRVDVSNDGKKWYTAKLLDGNDQPKNKAWAWTFWEIVLPIEYKVYCKAIDSSYNNQPDSIENIWNLRGILNNSIHQFNPFL